MDKIPAALQHKIDYIKALDIPVEQKYQRIGNAMIIYSASNKRAKITEATDSPRPPPPPIPPKRVIFPTPSKPIINEHNLSRFLWAGAFSLCAAIGFVIGVALGGSL